MYIYTFISLSLYLSLSLYIYIYIHMYTCIHGGLVPGHGAAGRAHHALRHARREPRLARLLERRREPEAARGRVHRPRRRAVVHDERWRLQRFSENAASSQIPFCQTPVGLSIFVLCLEGLCIGNPELAAPNPRKSTETGWGGALVHTEPMIASWVPGRMLAERSAAGPRTRHLDFRGSEASRYA